MDQLKLKSIGKMLTVKEIIDLSSTLKNSAIEAHGMEPGRKIIIIYLLMHKF